MIIKKLHHSVACFEGIPCNILIRKWIDVIKSSIVYTGFLQLNKTNSTGKIYAGCIAIVNSAKASFTTIISKLIDRAPPWKISDFTCKPGLYVLFPQRFCFQYNPQTIEQNLQTVYH